MRYPEAFDVLVIGGGHAGTEAALAAARLGAGTLLLTHNVETIGQMSCNPAIGGIGKGHLVREIDALGGAMAAAADLGGIQFRILNRSKGAAVRATRAQADRALYKAAVRARVENQPGLTLFQQEVTDLVMRGDRVVGVETAMGLSFEARSVVLTTGTFLGGRIHIGQSHHQGGRAGDPPANRLAERLREMPFRVERLKTGTPPRIDGRSIDFSVLEEQPGDIPTPVFSYLGTTQEHPRQVPCWITYTNEHTHQIIRDGLDRSPLFSGQIEGVGPRYCPSVEDKVVRFADKAAHQIFIEPEGLNTHEVYPNGISTSLPFDVQLELVRSIAGFERAHITRPGYAIEYDFFDPRDLRHSLQTRFVSGLYFAGQINGTTGYEEAGAQGLLAGTNAALSAAGHAPWYPGRHQAYLGVMIDDLITRGTREPYRMFTSRAEHRLLLREDNADLRLTPQGRTLGLVDDTRWAAFERKRESMERETARLWNHRVTPAAVAGTKLAQSLSLPLAREARALDLLRRPEVDYRTLVSLPDLAPGVTDHAVADQVEIQAKYAGYIERQQAEIARAEHYESLVIPQDIDYARVPGLSTEVREKLVAARPETVGHAGRLPGVTPAAVSLLLVHLKRPAGRSRRKAG